MDGQLDGSRDGYAGRMEVIEGHTGRRIRSEIERARIAAESLAPGTRVANVARHHGAPQFMKPLGKYADSGVIPDARSAQGLPIHLKELRQE